MFSRPNCLSPYPLGIRGILTDLTTSIKSVVQVPIKRHVYSILTLARKYNTCSVN